jgi:LysR family hydrogen peroxide-inducible transcriptional activator
MAGQKLMELDQLRYLVAIAERQSITRAAEDLGISQSALSRSILKLEDELGRPVLERKTRSVALTDAGLLLMHRAQQVLQLLEDTQAEIADDGHRGRIRLGAIPTIAPFLLPELLRDFATAYPECMVSVRENTTDSLVRSCTQGEIDLAILALPVPAKYLDVEEIFQEELLVVLPVGHPLAEQDSIRIKDVEPFPFVLLDEAHCLSDNIMSFCRRRAFQPVVLERASQIAMVQELVSLSHGISMIPAMARQRDSSGRRVYRSISGKKPTRTIVVVWNPYRFQSRVVKAFRHQLKLTCRRFTTTIGT